MNTASLILVALFGGALFVIVLLGVATLIYLHFQLKKQVESAVLGFATAAREINESIAGARTSFSGIRQDVKISLENHGNQVADVLAKHQKAFEETVGKVNGAALEAACARSIQAAGQIVAVAKELKTLLYAAEGGLETPQTPLAPEEYAPSDTIYAIRGPAAKMDDLASAAEAVEFQSENAAV